MLRVVRTRGKRKRDIWLESRGERGPDPVHALQAGQRTEWSSCGAIGHDPRGKRGSDPGEAVELFGAGDIEIDVERGIDAGDRYRPRRRRDAGRRGGSRRSVPRSTPTLATQREDRVHIRDLTGERGAIGSRKGGFLECSDSPHADAERRDGRDEEERSVFGRGGHTGDFRLGVALSVTESLRAVAPEFRARRRQYQHTYFLAYWADSAL